MKCGNCKGDHDTVSEVKDCYYRSAEDEANAKAEAEMEARMERFWEEGTEAQQAARFMENERDRQMELEFDVQIQQREAEQEERAYRDKMARDEALEASRVLDQMHGAATRELASEKQVQYALDLLREHSWPDVVSEDDLRSMERRQVSKLIDGLKQSPRRVVTARVPEPEVGMYIERDNGSVFRFYVGQKSGRILAKRLMFHGEDSVMGLDGKQKLVGSWRYQYVGSAYSVLRKHNLDRMTLEEAKEFGRMSETCVVCGRRLDVPESVDAGIGPVCASKGGW